MVDELDDSRYAFMRQCLLAVLAVTSLDKSMNRLSLLATLNLPASV